MFKCCGEFHKGKFIHRLYKPYYRHVEYGICPHCHTKHFIDYKQILENDDNYKEKVKVYKNRAAQREYEKWKKRLDNTYQGTLSKQFFHYGTYRVAKNGYYKTYRTNFNNEKEFLYKYKTINIV